MSPKRISPNTAWLSGLLFVGLLSATLGTGLIAAAGARAPALAAAPARTNTPTPTATLLAQGLQGQIVFSVGGGPRPYCTPNSGISLPAVGYDNARFSLFGDLFCLFDFTIGDTVTVKIIDPGGSLAVSVPLYIQGKDNGLFDPGFSLEWARLIHLPAHARAGQWTLLAEGPHESAKGYFTHPSSGPDLSVHKALSFETSPYDPRRTSFLAPGETLLVQGVNYDTNSYLPVAVYREGEPLRLHSAQLAATDGNGNFSAGFAIGSDYPAGGYYVVVVRDRNQDNYGMPDPKQGFAVIKPTQPCPGAMASHLAVGNRAMVSAGPNNNVREKPGTGKDKRILGQLHEYELLEIRNGPKCADRMVWWKVYSVNTGLDGWTAEGKDGNRWISLFSY